MSTDPSRKPIKGVEGWYQFARALSRGTPRRLVRVKNARQRLRRLRGVGR